MAAFNSLVFEPTTRFSGYGGMSLTVDSSGNLGNVSTPSTANLSVDNGVMSMKTPTNWGMVGGVISAIGGMVTGYYASRVQKAQARMQQNLAEFNQRQAERNAQLALMQSAQRIGQISRKYEGVKSSQKAAMAANGIVLGVGSAAEVTTTTDIDKEQSLQNERMNGMREAWGYRMQGLGYGQQAASANSVAQQADSLAAELPDTGAYHKAKVYSAALNGRYEEVIQEISAESPFNEVLMLLAIKANDQAWEKAKLLGNSARENYIKAVAANRVDEVVLALSYLESALKKDPSLRDIASVDGDVLDLLQEDE